MWRVCAISWQSPVWTVYSVPSVSPGQGTEQLGSTTQWPASVQWLLQHSEGRRLQHCSTAPPEGPVPAAVPGAGARLLCVTWRQARQDVTSASRLLAALQTEPVCRYTVNPGNVSTGRAESQSDLSNVDVEIYLQSDLSIGVEIYLQSDLSIGVEINISTEWPQYCCGDGEVSTEWPQYLCSGAELAIKPIKELSAELRADNVIGERERNTSVQFRWLAITKIGRDRQLWETPVASQPESTVYSLYSLCNDKIPSHFDKWVGPVIYRPTQYCLMWLRWSRVQDHSQQYQFQSCRLWIMHLDNISR